MKYIKHLFRKSHLLMLIPIILLPLPMSGYQEAKCGYVIVTMALYWTMDLLPLSVVALVPVFAFPLLGILSSNEVSTVYMGDNRMLTLGGLIIAVAIEHCNLNKRIALYVILQVGQSPRRLMAGFMMTTMFLSMWISNTATTAMMVPIIEAIVDALFKDSDVHQSDEDKITIKKMILLSVAYSANIGGTGSLTGTGPNLVLHGVITSSYPDQKELTFTSWMLYNVPGMLICTSLGWVWLQFFYIGCGNVQLNVQKGDYAKKLIKRKYDELGRMTFHEKMVLALFVLLVLIWFTRDPGFIPGWDYVFENVYGNEKNINNGSAAILIVVLLFMIPKKINFWPFADFSDPDYNKPSEGLLTWRIVHENVQWGLLLLIGSGIAMATASKKSGLSNWLGDQLTFLDFMPIPLLVFVICLLVASLTEVASNLATASILIPVLNDLSSSLCTHPLYLMMPAVICCSYAFMLPVATPPNAIVFAASQMKTQEMMKVGFGMNIMCVIISIGLINTYGNIIFNLDELPIWMTSSNDNLKIRCNVSVMH